MELNKQTYSNVATSDNKALVVYLLDISWSMGAPMQNGKSRLEVVMDALRFVLTEMVQRSLRQNKIRPRYRVAMIAYSDKLWNVHDGIQTIDKIKGVPNLTPQERTNTALGFKYVKKILEDDIKTWSPEDQRLCPAPLVVHMTDGTLNEIAEDPEPIVKQIQAIKVPDGNVLVENIYITDDINTPPAEISNWPGYQHGQDLKNPYANKLLAMSSKIPESYRLLINNHQTSTSLNLSPSAAMMFPGITPEFVRQAFAINGVSSTLANKAPDPRDEWDEDKKFPVKG
jgi:hypothetical protein